MVDRKLDMLVRELKYIQCQSLEYKRAGGLERMFGLQLMGTPFSTQQDPPDSGYPATRNEGVGILLDEMATAAWRRSGEVWEAVSSKIVMARLKWVVKRQQQSGDSRESSDVFVMVICAYEPRARATP